MMDYDALLNDIQTTVYTNDELKQIACTLIKYNKDLTSKLEKAKERSRNNESVIIHLEDSIFAFKEAFQDHAKKAQNIQEALFSLRHYVCKTLDCLENTDNLVQDFRQSTEQLVSRAKKQLLVHYNVEKSSGMRQQRSREQDFGKRSQQAGKSGAPRNRGYLSSDDENENPCKRPKSSCTVSPRKYKKGRPINESYKRRNSRSTSKGYPVSVDQENCENFAEVHAFAGMNGSVEINESDVEVFQKLNGVSFDESSQGSTDNEIENSLDSVERNKMLGMGTNYETDEIEHEFALREDSGGSPRINVLSQASSSHRHSTNCNHHVEFNESMFQETSNVKRPSKSPRRTSGTLSSPVHRQDERTFSDSNAFSANAVFSSEESEEFSTEDEASQTCTTGVDETESELPYQEIFSAQSSRKRKSRRRRSSRGRGRGRRASTTRNSFKRNISFSSGDRNHHNTQKGDQLFVVLYDFLKSPADKVQFKIYQETFSSGSLPSGISEVASSPAENDVICHSQMEVENGNDDEGYAIVQQESSDIMPEDTPYSGSVTDSCTTTQTENPDEGHQLSETPKLVDSSICTVTSPEIAFETLKSTTKKKPRERSSSKNISKATSSEGNDEVDQSPHTVEMSDINDDGSALEVSFGPSLADNKKSFSESFNNKLPEEVLPPEDKLSSETQSSVEDSAVFNADSCDQTTFNSVGENSSFVDEVTSGNLSKRGSSIISQRKHDVLSRDAALLDKLPDTTSKKEEETPNSVEEGKICDNSVVNEKTNLEKSKPVSKTGRPRGRPRKVPIGNVSAISTNQDQSNNSEESMVIETNKDANDEKLPNRPRPGRKRKLRELQSDVAVESNLPKKEAQTLVEEIICDVPTSGVVISEDLTPATSRKSLREKKSKAASVCSSAKSRLLANIRNENSKATDSEANENFNFNSESSTINPAVKQLDNVTEADDENFESIEQMGEKFTVLKEKQKLNEPRNASEKAELQNIVTSPEGKSDPLSLGDPSDHAVLNVKDVPYEAVSNLNECPKLEASKKRVGKALGLARPSRKNSLLKSHRSSPRHKEAEVGEVESESFNSTEDSDVPLSVDSSELFHNTELTEKNSDSIGDANSGARNRNLRGKKASVSHAAKKRESSSDLEFVSSPKNKFQQNESDELLLGVTFTADLGSMEDSKAESLDNVSSGSKLGHQKRASRTRRGKADTKESSNRSRISGSPIPEHSVHAEFNCDDKEVKPSPNQPTVEVNDSNVKNRTEADFSGSDSLDILESLRAPGRKNSSRDRLESADGGISNSKSESLDRLPNSSQFEEKKTNKDLEAKQVATEDKNESSSCAASKPSNFTMSLRCRQSVADFPLSRLNLLSNLDQDEDKPDSLDTNHSGDRNPADSPYDPEEPIDKAFGSRLVSDSEVESEFEEGEIIDDDTDVTPVNSPGVDIVEDSCDGADVTLEDKPRENDPSSENEEYVAVDEADEEESDACKEDPQSSSPSR